MGSDFLPEPAKPLVRARGLTKRYRRGGFWRPRTAVTALDNVDLEILSSTTLALVGASGSGKSTMARCLAGLEAPDSGQIWIEGRGIHEQSSRSLGLARPCDRVQMVFQDPVTSMNPRFTAGEVVEEPLLIRSMEPHQRRQAAKTALSDVGLLPEWLDRSVMEFSGGQRERLAIARALVVRPKLLVLDEALTGLDLSTQAQIVNLLLDLKVAHGLTYVLVSHNLALVARIADSIAVMSRGRIVETGATDTILTAPQHEETALLLACARAAQANLGSISKAIS